MFDTMIEFTIASEEDIDRFDRETQEVHDAAYQRHYGFVFPGYNSQEEYSFTREEFIGDFLRSEVAQGARFTACVQFAQGMPLEMECIAQHQE